MKTTFSRTAGILSILLCLAACYGIPTRSEWSALQDRDFPVRDFVFFSSGDFCTAENTQRVIDYFPWKEVQNILRKDLDTGFSWPGSEVRPTPSIKGSESRRLPFTCGFEWTDILTGRMDIQRWAAVPRKSNSASLRIHHETARVRSGVGFAVRVDLLLWSPEFDKKSRLAEISIRYPPKAGEYFAESLLNDIDKALPVIMKRLPGDIDNCLKSAHHCNVYTEQ